MPTLPNLQPPTPHVLHLEQVRDLYDSFQFIVLINVCKQMPTPLTSILTQQRVLISSEQVQYHSSNLLEISLQISRRKADIFPCNSTNYLYKEIKYLNLCEWYAVKEDLKVH